MRVFIDIEYRPSEGDALSEVSVGPNRMRNDFTIKKVDGNLEIRVKPKIHENEDAFTALIQALQTSDQLMIGLGQLVEAAFLTGIKISKNAHTG